EQASVSLDDAAIDFAVVNAVLDFIDDNLGDPALSPEMISAALGLSRSRLYRLFQHLDGIASEIRRRRLRRSLHDLLNPDQLGLQRSEIAYRWGFRSDSDYIRAFKRQYGLTPGQAKAARTSVLSSEPKAETVSQQSYDAWIRAFAR
ncbi:MAG TPA: transcriptional regulator, partial [Oceanicaulis sp.]|nr:transcriptional regulator [Oceanicaulis sp.]